jgi:N-acetylgalactosamine-N,N'-diacetylbacillosaminyl-diphospho-undecaprenol 4-alpha-N-acetylgalactosaminyltransferase
MRGMSSFPAIFLINSLGIGGAERAVMTLTSELCELGRDMRLLCLERAPVDEALVPRVSPQLLSRMSSTAPALLKLAALPFLAVRLCRYISRENAGVVASHLFRANFVNVLAKVLASVRHRCIVVNHTRLSRLQHEGFQGRINWMLCKWLYPRADLVANVSAGAATESAGLLGLPPERSIVLHDPIDTRVAAFSTREREPGRMIVGVGRLIRLKRYQDLIDAFGAIAGDYSDLELRLVGDGPCRKELERRAFESGIGSRVKFTGKLADPFFVLAGSTAFVSTSETEGFGMAIVEALAAAVPVVASDCAYGPREILSPSSDCRQLLQPGADIELAQFGILYPVGSVSALEKALRALLGNDALRADLSRKGPVRATDFAVHKSAAAYERVLFPA